MTQKLTNTLRPIYNFLMLLIRLNILITIYLNFKTQPFRNALKFPIFVYGKLFIHSLEGDIIINGSLKTGMIKMGYRYHDLVPISLLPNQLLVDGKLIFNGFALISGGVSISANKGSLSIGNCCTVGGGSLIKCLSGISIGDNTTITYGCTIFDSNIHYIKDVESGEIKKNNDQIVIGKNCWINAETYIAKGTIVPDFSITARCSLLNKDYLSFGTNIFLVGSPARPQNKKVQRIFNTDEEMRLNYFFHQNPDQNIIKCDIGLYEDFKDNLYKVQY